MNTTIDDLAESIKSKIINDQISMTEAIHWLASIFHPNIYDLSKIPPENIPGRKRAILHEIKLVEEITNVALPKLKTKEETILFLAFISGFGQALPEDCKINAEGIRNNVNRHLNKKEGCYIATLVYGSYHHSQVIILREFRDSTLNKCIMGRAFTRVYYKISPTIVSLLKNKPILNRIIKAMLDKLIQFIRKSK